MGSSPESKIVMVSIWCLVQEGTELLDFLLMRPQLLGTIRIMERGISFLDKILKDVRILPAVQLEKSPTSSSGC